MDIYILVLVKNLVPNDLLKEAHLVALDFFFQKQEFSLEWFVKLIINGVLEVLLCSCLPYLMDMITRWLVETLVNDI